MATQSDLQTAVESNNPLQREGLLKFTFDLVGGGEVLFIRAVNKSWKAFYEELILGQQTEQQADEEEHAHTGSCTSYQAVFASISRLRLACESGLQLHEASEVLQLSAGLCADIGTLKAAYELGLLITPAVMYGATYSRCLSKLQWLRTEQHCPFPEDITVIAAGAGDVTMLRWLQDH
eukprot:3910-Heterococcus_DN1.PRE.2